MALSPAELTRTCGEPSRIEINRVVGHIDAAMRRDYDQARDRLVYDKPPQYDDGGAVAAAVLAIYRDRGWDVKVMPGPQLWEEHWVFTPKAQMKGK